MMKSTIKNLSTRFFISRIQFRALATQSNAQKGIKQDITNGQYLTCNFTNGLENRKVFLINSNPILSNSEPYSRNIGVRHFSSASTVETLASVSKYLEGSPVDWFQNLLLWTHSTTGLPWWATIIINSVALRFCFITPLTLYQMHTAARLENVQNELEGFVWKLKKESERSVELNKYSKIMARTNYNRALRNEMRKLYIRDNCHPAKIFAISIVYFATFVFQTIAIRNLCYMLPISDFFAQLTQLELSLGGFGWIRDLTKVDSYYIIPAYLSFLTFCMLETKNLLKRTETSYKLLRLLQKSLIVVFPIVSIIISSNMPAAVILSWATNSTLAYGEMLLFSIPKARRLVGIPATMSDQDRPFSVLYEKIKEKYRLPRPLKESS